MSDYLPPSVLSNILSRLPVKTLLRFRCVCKSWSSLISSPNFIHKHLNLTLKNPHHLLLRYLSLSPKKEIYSLRSNDDSFNELAQIKCPFKTVSGNFFRVIGCCNGLICLSDDYFGFRYTTIIWNPAVRRYVSLPVPRVCYDSYGPYTYALGFGFDPTTMDYKVVRIAYVYVDDGFGYGRYALPPEVEVYELSAGVWRNVSANGVLFKVVEFLWSSAFVNGAVHWVVYDRNEEGGGEEIEFSNRVLVFDMGSDVFSYLELPDQLAHAYPLDLSISAFGDTIVVYWCRGRILGRSCDRCAVWVMQEYGNARSWSERFFVDLEEGISNVVGLRTSGELLLEKWMGSLVSFDPVSDRIRSVGIHGGKDSFFVGNYAESLALLDAQTDVLGEQLKFIDGADSEEESVSSERERANEETDLLMNLVAHMFLASAPLHL